jgi:hypothetical protein
MAADKVTPEKESQRDWAGILPVVFGLIFLFVTLLPLAGWISGAAGIERSWIPSASILLSSSVSILALLATSSGGRFLPKSFYGKRAGK